MDLVDDDGPDGGEQAATALGREQDVERFGGADQDVGRPPGHPCAILGGRVARPHQDAHGGEKGVAGRDRGQGEREILLDVVPERLERGQVEDLGLVGEVGSLPELAVDGGEERGERLAAPGGRGDQGVAPAPDERPSLLLGRGGLAERLREPAPHGRMKGL